jgi:hypothetical protein
MIVITFPAPVLEIGFGPGCGIFRYIDIHEFRFWMTPALSEYVATFLIVI